MTGLKAGLRKYNGGILGVHRLDLVSVADVLTPSFSFSADC